MTSLNHARPCRGYSLLMVIGLMAVLGSMVFGASDMALRLLHQQRHGELARLERLTAMSALNLARRAADSPEAPMRAEGPGLSLTLTRNDADASGTSRSFGFEATVGRGPHRVQGSIALTRSAASQPWQPAHIHSAPAPLNGEAQP